MRPLIVNLCIKHVFDSTTINPEFLAVVLLKTDSSCLRSVITPNDRMKNTWKTPSEKRADVVFHAEIRWSYLFKECSSCVGRHSQNKTDLVLLLKSYLLRAGNYYKDKNTLRQNYNSDGKQVVVLWEAFRGLNLALTRNSLRLGLFLDINLK